MQYLPESEKMAGQPPGGYTDRHILEENPTAGELKEWIGRSGLSLKRFFNTSGMKYRELQLKERLPGMSEEEQVELLATDGMLVKRPLLVTEDRVIPGFREAEWLKRLDCKKERRAIIMETKVTREAAWNLLKKYNQEEFHRIHGLTVEGTMRWFAKDQGYADEAEFWGLAGLLHDVDWEKYPRNTVKKRRSFWQRSKRSRNWCMQSAVTDTVWYRMWSRRIPWRRFFSRWMS